MKQVIFAIFLVFFSTVLANCQINNNSQWTWVAGDSTLDQVGVYGTQGVGSPNNKPGERSLPAGWKDIDGNFWLFGGAPNSGGRLNDLWKYNPGTNIWTWVNGNNQSNQPGIYGTKGIPASTNQPGARAGCAFWSDTNGNLWLFGGRGFDETSSFTWMNDLWKYNITTNQWTWISGNSSGYAIGNYGIQGVSSPANIPGGRDRPQYWSDNAGNFWLMGGYTVVTNSLAGPSNDLWKYSISTNEWTWVNGDININTNGNYGALNVPATTNKPGCRVSGVSWNDNNGNLWIFGGYGYDANSTSLVYFNDTWKYNTASGEWAWVSGDSTGNQEIRYGVQGVSSTTNNPGSRYGCFKWKDNQGNLWLMGGEIDFGGLVEKNDLWVFGNISNKWTWVSGDSTKNPAGHYGQLGSQAIDNVPGNKALGAYWTDKDNNFWLFGGATYRPAGLFLYGTTDLWKLAPISANEIKICNNSDTILKATVTGTSYQWQISVDSINFTDLHDNSIYSGTTTNTIHLSGITSSNSGHKYRCLVDGNNDTAFTLVFENTWTGAISNEWENPANWSCNELPDQYTDVDISLDHVIINSNVTVKS